MIRCACEINQINVGIVHKRGEGGGGGGGGGGGSLVVVLLVHPPDQIPFCINCYREEEVMLHSTYI